MPLTQDFEKKNKEFENRELLDAESKCNEILDQFIQKIKKERSHFDFNRFKARFLGKDYADTDKRKLVFHSPRNIRCILN